jgi:hypothetical protein
MVPLTYILTKKFDLVGPAIAALVATSIYNFMRIAFLYKKFRLFPFTRQSFYAVLLGGTAYLACYYLFRGMHGFPGLIARSVVFLLLYGTGAIYFNLSPDIPAVMETVKKRLGRGR